jgi:hypothetical protein
MKAYIDRDALVKIINEHTVFSHQKDVPNNLRWYQIPGQDGFFTWDFVAMDKVLVDVIQAPEYLKGD